MYMAKGLDSGDMILKAEEKIKDDDTYGTLYDRLSYIGADLLIKTLDLIERGEIVRVPQNDDDATLAPMITRDMEHIDWDNTCLLYTSQLRALFIQKKSVAKIQWPIRYLTLIIRREMRIN